MNKNNFIKESLCPHHLSEEQGQTVINHMLQHWDNDFLFLFGKDIMPYLMNCGLDSQLAFSIMESLRKGNGLTSEWETILSEKGISLEFVTHYQNALPESKLRQRYNHTLHECINKVKEQNH